MNGDRLSIPPSCPAELAEVMELCWKTKQDERPDFSQILDILKEVPIDC